MAFKGLLSCLQLHAIYMISRILHLDDQYIKTHVIETYFNKRIKVKFTREMAIALRKQAIIDETVENRNG